MSYRITEQDKSVTVATRTEAVRALGEWGHNHYIAVRLLDAADGLVALDVAREVTVTRVRITDFYLDGSPVYSD